MKLGIWSTYLFGCDCVVTVGDNMRKYVMKVKADQLGGDGTHEPSEENRSKRMRSRTGFVSTVELKYEAHGKTQKCRQLFGLWGQRRLLLRTTRQSCGCIT